MNSSAQEEAIKHLEHAKVCQHDIEVEILLSLSQRALEEKAPLRSLLLYFVGS